MGNHKVERNTMPVLAQQIEGCDAWKEAAKGLSNREIALVANYVLTGNGALSARLAGYIKGTTNADRVAASKVLAKPQIKAAIAAFKVELAGKYEVSAAKVLREWSLLAFANMMDYTSDGVDGSRHIDLSKLTREQAAALSEITVDEYMDGERPVKKVKVKFHSKTDALEALSKYLGLFERDNEQRKPSFILSVSRKLVASTLVDPLPVFDGSQKVLDAGGNDSSEAH